MDDSQLIEAFVRENSESAFRTLVERHAGLVHASALRQTGDAQLAQDVAQAVFTLLARKAGSLRRGAVLSGWLFQTTRFVAARAMRSEQRRQRREQEAFDMQQLQANDETWRQVTPVLDDALAQLSSADREVILLRYIEGRSLREVSLALGVTEDAAKKRVARAIEKLRQGLGRNGITVSASTLGTTLATQAATPVPAPLVASLLRHALAGASAGSPVSALVTETIAAWGWVKMKWLSGLSASLAVVVMLMVKSFPETDRLGESLSAAPTTLAGEGGRKESPVPLVATIPQLAPNVQHLSLQVLSDGSGKPIPNAPVFLSVWRDQGVENQWNLSTDAHGVCEVTYERDAGRIDIGVFAPGWEARYATWPSEGHTGFPSNYVLRLASVTNFIGGVVRDPQSRPLFDAEIWLVGHASGDSSHQVRPRERFGFANAVPAARTDQDGRWVVASVPPAHPGFQIEARHPAFADTTLVASSSQRTLNEIDDERLKQLWIGELVSTMHPVYLFAGTVVDEHGTPIEGAKIQHREGSEVFTTDAAGRFHVPRLKEGPWIFTVTADGFSPVRTNAIISSSAVPALVAMPTGAALRVRVIDEKGTEVTEAEVGLEQWGENRHDFTWRERTDFSGRIEWLSAPSMVELELFARKDGFCYTRDVRVKADGNEHTIEIHRTLVLFGRVVDAETGREIGNVVAVPGYGPPDRFSDASLRWYGGETVRSTNGLFKLTFQEKQYPWQVRVSADGYDDWTSGPLTNRIQATIDVAMKRSRSEDSVRGVVLLPNGTPAIGVQVALLTFEHNVTLHQQAFRGDPKWMTKSGAQAEFSFPVNDLAHSVAAVSEAGYVHRRISNPGEAVTLRLQPWGRVEGLVDESAAKLGVSDVRLYDPAAHNYQGRVSLLNFYREKLDASRRFVFESVPPGEFSAFINSGEGIPFHHQTPLVVRAGETTRVVIAEKPGTRITGRFIAPLGSAIRWKKDFLLSHFYASLPQASAPSNLGPANERAQRELEFWTSAAGREDVNTRRVYAAFVRDDGSFASVECLPPGQYRFTTVFKIAGDSQKNFSTTQELKVEEDQAEELPLGEIPLM